jgi:hypothetical protein
MRRFVFFLCGGLGLAAFYLLAVYVGHKNGFYKLSGGISQADLFMATVLAGIVTLLGMIVSRPEDTPVTVVIERVRRFNVTESFELSGITFDVGDRLELYREKPEDFFKVRIMRANDSTTEIGLESAQMLFRNGVLG